MRIYLPRSALICKLIQRGELAELLYDGRLIRITAAAVVAYEEANFVVAISESRSGVVTAEQVAEWTGFAKVESSFPGGGFRWQTGSRWGGWLPLPALRRQDGAVTQQELGATTMEITTVGIDLAKNVFQVHAINCTGEVLVRRALRRAQVMPFFRKLPPCLIGNNILSQTDLEFPAAPATMQRCR